MILDQCLAAFMKEKGPEVMAFFSNIGSINGLKALQMGKCHIGTLHLYDPETERYNAPFLQRYLPGKRVLLFNLSYRHQGLIIRPESRETVKGIGDLTRSGIKIINREYGSGTRCLLDHILSQKGINARVINVHTIRPMDTKTILKAARETRGIVVCEEHTVIGGLASSVDEVVAENYPTKVVRLGIKNRFGQSGEPPELLKEYNLTAPDIEKAALSVLS